MQFSRDLIEVIKQFQKYEDGIIFGFEGSLKVDI